MGFKLKAASLLAESLSLWSSDLNLFRIPLLSIDSLRLRIFFLCKAVAESDLLKARGDCSAEGSILCCTDCKILAFSLSNKRERKSVSSYRSFVIRVLGWFSITFLYSFYSNSYLDWNTSRPANILAAPTLSRLRSAMPILSLGWLSLPISNKFDSFSVGSRLFECEFIKPR